MPDNLQSKLVKLTKAAQSRQAAGRLDDAIMIWRTILLAQPDHVPTLYALGKTLFEQGRIAEAEATFRVAVERAPQQPALWRILAKVLMHWENWEEAENCLHNALARAPEDVDTLLSLGQLKLKSGAVMEAMAGFQTVLDQDSANKEALLGMGEGRWKQGQWQEAVRCFQQAAMLHRSDPAVQFRLARAQLSLGQWQDSWDYFEARTKLDKPDWGRIPTWQGEAIDDKTLLVNHEGGLSDALQFGRLAERVPAQQVIYRCPASISRLLKGSHWSVEIASDRDPKPRADVQTSLLSLPALLKLSPPDLPGRFPYLRADPTELSHWRSRLGDGVRIGISWQGGSRLFGEGTRQIPLTAFEPLCGLPRIRLFSLQKGEGREQLQQLGLPIEDLDPDLDEGRDAFLDTAAAINCLTMVISVDNAIAHLAAALGKPVWCCLPHGLPEWRWQASGRDTPWYPTMDLFHCPNPGDWRGLMRELARRLQTMMGGFDPDNQR